MSTKKLKKDDINTKKNETERVLARFKQWLAITYGGVFLNFFVTIMAREKVQKHSSIDDDWQYFKNCYVPLKSLHVRLNQW